MNNKLHLGSGGNILTGWSNLDMSITTDSHDAKTNTSLRHWLAPLLNEKDDTADYVYNEHFIEHLDECEGFKLLQESHRVLKKGATLRICTPSLDKYVASFLQDDFEDHTLFRNGTQFLNYAIYGEGWTNGDQVEYLKILSVDGLDRFRSANHSHRYIYSEKDLKEKLAFIGFSNIVTVSWGLSRYPDLRGLEHHQNGTLLELLVEATK
tara:strand:- start:40024 stop:40650 length:627 start_codon:yes stop_codon:yes gene_type:complete